MKQLINIKTLIVVTAIGTAAYAASLNQRTIYPDSTVQTEIQAYSDLMESCGDDFRCPDDESAYQIDFKQACIFQLKGFVNKEGQCEARN